MIDPLAVQRADSAADVLPQYDVRYLRLNAGLSEEQTGEDIPSSITPYVEKAVEAFETDTSLKVYKHDFTYEIDGRVLYVDQEREILVPGLDCTITAFTCDGVTVPAAAYTTRKHRPTGCAVLKPNRYWQVDRDSKIEVRFSAGIPSTGTMPVGVQSIVAVRIRFDVFGGTGDLLRYNEERKRYTIGTIIYR